MGVIIILFFLWGLSMISLSFFFASIFKRSRTANISVTVAIICSVIIALAIDSIYEEEALSLAYFLWPPFAFYRALGILNRFSFNKAFIVTFFCCCGCVCFLCGNAHMGKIALPDVGFDYWE